MSKKKSKEKKTPRSPDWYEKLTTEERRLFMQELDAKRKKLGKGKFAAKTSDGKKRCQAWKAYTTNQCAHVAVKGKEYCTKHGPQGNRKLKPRKKILGAKKFVTSAAYSEFERTMDGVLETKESMLNNHNDMKASELAFRLYIREIEELGIPMVKAAPKIISMMKKLTEQKRMHHSMTYGDAVTVRLDVVIQLIGNFDTLIKEVCAGDFGKIEKFARGMDTIKAGIDRLVTNDNPDDYVKTVHGTAERK